LIIAFIVSRRLLVQMLSVFYEIILTAKYREI
jgi:hypothetical protein